MAPIGTRVMIDTMAFFPNQEKLPEKAKKYSVGSIVARIERPGRTVFRISWDEEKDSIQEEGVAVEQTFFESDSSHVRWNQTKNSTSAAAGNTKVRC